MTICERIKSICEEQGITIYRVEKDCGFGNGSIMKWENSSPKVENVIKVANYFDVSTDYLLGLADKPNSPLSWYIFKHKIFDKGNKSLEELATEIKKPLSMFTDWELGAEPDERTLWTICNTYGLTYNPFEKTKKAALTERPESNTTVFSVEELTAMLEENDGIDWLEKLYKELKEQQQKAYVLLWLIQYLASEGLPVKQILGK